MPSVELIAEGILPTLQDIPGYEGFIVLFDPESGQVVGLSLWESEETLVTAEPLLNAMRSAETASRSVESVTTTTLRVVELDLK